jgi:hypothetical protein
MRELLVLALFTIIGVWACEANADSRCTPLKEGQKKIEATGEVVVFIAISQRGHITQISINEKTGMWTAAYITSDERLCLADFGSEAKLLRPSQKVKYE